MHNFIIIFTISLFICNSNLFATATKQLIVEHPQNTTARIGDTVILKCRVENQKGTLQWVKNGFGLGITRDLPLIERYRMVGKLNLGEYNLQIRNVSIDDDDFYECQLSPTDNEKIQISNVAKLAVIAQPSAPTFIGIEQQKTIKKQSVISIEAIESNLIHLSCRSSGGRPAARIDWAITDDFEALNIISYITADNSLHPHHPLRSREHLSSAVASGELFHYVGKIIETIETNKDGFSTIISNLSFAPSKAENNKFLACLASHETYIQNNINTPKSVVVLLDVSYRPKIRIEIDERESSIMEGGRLVLRCFVDAKPSRDLNIKWNWNGEDKRLAVLDQHRLMISGLKIKDNGAHVTCTATNSIGTESAFLKLDIPYGPRFMSTNQTKLIQRGESANFQCETLGNPIPEIKWFRKNSNDFIATGFNYTLNDVQEWESGEYRCVATVPGFEPKTLTHQLYLKGPPIVYLVKDFTEEEDIASITCEIQTRVLPLKILWLYNMQVLIDSEINNNQASLAAIGNVINYSTSKSVINQKVRIQNIIRNYGIESRIYLKYFSSKDYGLYNCTAYNEFGVAHDQFKVFRRSFIQRIVELLQSLPLSYRIGIIIGLACFCISILMIFCMRCQNSDNINSNKQSFNWCCCFRCCGKSKNLNYSHDNVGDVIVKCEALDGAQFYPELYGNPQMEQSDIIYTKDYISLPQSNPDLDYLPPSAMNFGVISYGQPQINNKQSPYTTQHTFSNDYNVGFGAQDLQNIYETYTPQSTFAPVLNQGSYSNEISYDNVGGVYASRDYLINNSSAPTRSGIGLSSNGMMLMGSSPLETLTEVVTPESENGVNGIGDGSGSGDALICSTTQQRPLSRISTHV